jgi:hypothetical protein
MPVAISRNRNNAKALPVLGPANQPQTTDLSHHCHFVAMPPCARKSICKWCRRNTGCQLLARHGPLIIRIPT